MASSETAGFLLAGEKHGRLVQGSAHVMLVIVSADFQRYYNVVVMASAAHCHCFRVFANYIQKHIVASYTKAANTFL